MENQYTCISNHEVQKLTKLKAPPSVWSCYLALASFDYGFKKGHCWPSISSLSERIGGHLSERRIYSALKWMVDNQVIRREKARKNGKTNPNRFQLILRKTFKLVQTLLSTSGKKIEKQSRNQQKKSNVNKTDPFQHDRKRTRRKNRNKNFFISQQEASRRNQQSLKSKNNFDPELPTPGEQLFGKILLGREKANQVNLKKILEEMKKNSSLQTWVDEFHPEYSFAILNRTNNLKIAFNEDQKQKLKH